MIGVFGARGFIGRHVCDRLARSGREVLALDRAESIEGVEAQENVRFAAIDFADPETYREHLAELDAAVLLVSASVPGTFADDMAGEVRENVLPHARFLQALSRARGFATSSTFPRAARSTACRRPTSSPRTTRSHRSAPMAAPRR